MAGLNGGPGQSLCGSHSANISASNSRSSNKDMFVHSGPNFEGYGSWHLVDFAEASPEPISVRLKFSQSHDRHRLIIRVLQSQSP